MINWFKKEDKPAYLKYKRGRIFEKERTERKHLLIDEPEDVNFDEIEEEILSAPPKKRLKMFLGVIGLIGFALVFFQLIGTYTTNLYGVKTDTSQPLEIRLPKLSTPDLEVNLPDVPDIDINASLPDVNVSIDPEAPSLQEAVDSLKSDTYTFSASVHGKLVQSIISVKDNVVRYTEGQANKMTVSSRIEKEQASYRLIQTQIETRLSQKQYQTVNEKTVLELLHSQIIAFNQDLDVVKEASRTELTDLTNQLIESENDRRNTFLQALKHSLTEDDIPFQEADGQLTF